MNKSQILLDEIISECSMRISQIFEFQGNSYSLNKTLTMAQTRELFDYHLKIMRCYSAIKESMVNGGQNVKN